MTCGLNVCVDTHPLRRGALAGNQVVPEDRSACPLALLLLVAKVQTSTPCGVSFMIRCEHQLGEIHVAVAIDGGSFRKRRPSWRSRPAGGAATEGTRSATPILRRDSSVHGCPSHLPDLRNETTRPIHVALIAVTETRDQVQFLSARPDDEDGEHPDAKGEEKPVRRYE